MTKEEFNHRREELSHTKTDFGTVLGFANPYLSVHEIETGIFPVSVLDHIILPSEGYFSFLDNDLIGFNRDWFASDRYRFVYSCRRSSAAGVARRIQMCRQK